MGFEMDAVAGCRSCRMRGRRLRSQWWDPSIHCRYPFAVLVFYMVTLAWLASCPKFSS